MLQLLFFVGLLTFMSVQGQLSVIWNGSLVTGPVFIFLDELPVDDFKRVTIGDTSRPGALVCRSENRARVSWHFVDGSIVSDAPRTMSRAIIQTRTGTGVTPSISRLSKGIKGFASSDSHINGIWHCRLNAMGDTSYEDEISIGIYSRDSGLGVLNMEESEVSLSPPPSSTPLNFTLYGDSVGGPPTNYFWSRNGEVISNGGPYDISIGLNEASSDRYTRSVYRSTLTVTGDFPGHYAYHFTNRISPQIVLNSTEIQRGTAPTSVEIRQNGEFVEVMWMANALPTFGFHVTVQPGKLSLIAELTDVPVSFLINDSVGVFRAEVRALFYPLPSEIVEATTTVLGLFPPLVTELEVTDMVVRALWIQPPFSFSLIQDQYMVALERATGSEQALCPDIEDSRIDSTTIMNATYFGLHEFSLYRMTITANFSVFGQSETLSTVVAFTTDDAVPTGAPRNVTANITSRSVIMSWDTIECLERNGVIINYVFEFGQRLGAAVYVEVTNRTISANGLTPYTEYTFRVAGVNIIGLGPFSTLVITTDEDVPGVVSNLIAEAVFTSVVITWRAPREPNGVIIAYEVTYSVDYNDSITVNVTHSSMSLILPLYLEAEVTNISVRAYTSIGPGPPADVDHNVSIPEIPMPPIVDEVVAEVLDPTSVNVSWESVTVPGIVNYTVYYSPRDDAMGSQSEQAVTVPSSESSVVIEDLMTGVEYQFQVVVIAELDMEIFVGKRSMRAVALPLFLTTPLQSIPVTDSLVSAGIIVAGIIVSAGVVIAILAALIAVMVMVYKRHRKKKELKKPKLDKLYRVATIVGAPKITEFPSDDIYVVERECVFFNVVIQGKPKPQFTWFHGDTRLESDTNNITIQLDGSVCISPAQPNHSGVYKLCVTNSKGSAERTIKLTVLHEYEESTTTEYQDIVVTLDPVPVEEFGAYVARGHANGNEVFRLQFNSLDTGDEHPKTIGTQIIENQKFNRFGNITVYDHNRILLKPLEDFERCKGEFVNACYIQGYSIPDRFIATLGPKRHMLIDFWRLVWQERPPSIVMVTNLKECRKIKCEQFWPEYGSDMFGPFKVTLTGQQVFCDYIIRTMKVTCESRPTKRLKLTHYQYTAWPEQGVPEHPTSMLSFVKKVSSKHKTRKKPILVHCSAGIGRTGVFICMDNVLDKIKRKQVVDIARIINKMRHQRMKMVQTLAQYIFIHDAILESLVCGDTQIPAACIRAVLRKSNLLETQFQILELVSPKQSEVSCTVAMENHLMNRCSNYLPSDKYRVILSGESPDYIHAVSVNSYIQQNAYIIAEGPMKSTARNMWKVILDKKCDAVVMLSDLIENGEWSSWQYWPSAGNALQCEEYTVVLISEEVWNGYTTRTLHITNTVSGTSSLVTQFHITCWEPDGRCYNLRGVLDVIEELAKLHRRTGIRPVFVHCSDTVTRSGMFCAIAIAVELCKREGIVDVFQVVQLLRVRKPGAVPTIEDYQTVYDAILLYLKV